MPVYTSSSSKETLLKKQTKQETTNTKPNQQQQKNPTKQKPQREFNLNFLPVLVLIPKRKNLASVSPPISKCEYSTYNSSEDSVAELLPMPGSHLSN